VPKFSYIAKDLEGKTYQNVVEAENRAELIKKLQAQKYFIVSVDEVTSPGRGGALRPLPPVGPRKFSHKRIRLIDKLVFARQMATMLGAGVNLSRTLNVLLQQIDSENLFKVVRKVQRDVENGISLSMAMSQHPKAFDQFWVSLVEVGEASGTMPTVLNKLSNHLERQATFQSTIISGFIYPAILICICMGAILFFALVVGPKFQEVFASMRIKLPILTVALLGLFDFIKKNLFLLAFVIGGGVFALVSFVRNTYGGRKMFEGLMLGLPVLGNVYRYALVEKFTSQMALLIESGVPILYALDITERLVNNNTCAEVINLSWGYSVANLFLN
jgi:type IV pilus assembly protein PilC